MKRVTVFLFFSLIVCSIIAMQTGCAQTPGDSRSSVAVKTGAAAPHSAADLRTDDPLIGNF